MSNELAALTAQTAEDVRVLREALAVDQGTVTGRTGLIAAAHPARIARLLDAVERERASRQQAQAELEQAREERNRARLQGERDARRVLQYVIERALQNEREACIDLVALHGGPVDLEAAIRARGALPRPPEPLAWRFTGLGGLKRFMTQRQYDAQTPAVQKWYEPISPDTAVVGRARAAIQDYYAALDNRQHGGIAQSKAFSEIERALGMEWEQGASKKAPPADAMAVRP